MRVYRGPKSKPFCDKSHEYVSRISPEKLESCIRDGRWIQFDINKEGYLRESICTAMFEKEDFIPMMSALLKHMSEQQQCFSNIISVVKDASLSNKDKIKKIEDLISKIEE